eukprot:5828104-Pleurochrysis_carterae.AAC.1
MTSQIPSPRWLPTRSASPWLHRRRDRSGPPHASNRVHHKCFEHANTQWVCPKATAACPLQ